MPRLMAALTFVVTSVVLPVHHVRAQSPTTFREYRLEAAHSLVGFSIGFLGHPVHGRFDDVRGTIVYVPQHPTSSSVTVAIATKSINTGSAHRDEHLRSADFFDAVKYPTIFFTSRRVERVRDTLVAIGDLTMHGVTHSVTIPFVEPAAAAADPHGS